MSNFHPLEVVGRGSDTQLQVGENLNNLFWNFKEYLTKSRISGHFDTSGMSSHLIIHEKPFGFEMKSKCPVGQGGFLAGVQYIINSAVFLSP